MTVSLQRWSPSYSQPEFYISSVVPPPPSHITPPPLPHTLHLLPSSHITPPPLPHTLHLSSSHITPTPLLTHYTSPPHTLHLLSSSHITPLLLTHYTYSPSHTLHLSSSHITPPLLLTHYTSPPHTLHLLPSLTHLTQGCQHVCHAGREASIPLPSPWHKAKTETPGADHSGTLRIPREGDGTFVAGGNGSPLQATPA